ncbi:hypothetical protein [Bacillus cereus]|uniref:hypothetical protein n=1 Tax=Bacillus cereus TaxID=1396 RepID=UPI000BF9C4BC|nr:hypothetical protein [Bacillus cereus]PFD13984.1 hypothetical protein CN295_04925 [Bacillus cereus]PFH95701.1 hypothetical protein COI78_08705 [Bacillus cereus]
MLTEFDCASDLLFIEIATIDPPTLLATVTLNIDDATNRVWLTGTVLFRVSSGVEGAFAGVIIQIYVNDPTFTSSPIFYTEDCGVNSGQVTTFTTSFTFADIIPLTGPVIYFLTAIRGGVDFGIAGVSVDRVSFTGAEITANNL